MPGVSQSKSLLIAKVIGSSPHAIENIGELRLMDGVTSEMYSALKPYIAALPTNSSPTLINVNTAEAPVLMTLDSNLTLLQAETIVACRKRYGAFLNENTFLNACVLPSGIKPLSSITTESQYFLLHSTAKKNNHQWQLNTLLFAQADKNHHIKARVIWQSLS